MHEQDRRSSYRCAVAADQEAAILRTDKRDIVVQVREKSAGGFGVVTEQPVKLEQGAILSLATSGGCCEVQVVHVIENEGEFRIGLKNLRELKFLRGGPLLSLYTLRRMLTTSSGLLRLAIIIVMCAGFFVWGATLPVDEWLQAASGRWTPSLPRGSGFHDPVQREKELALSYLRLDGLTKQRFVVALNLSSNQQSTIRGILDDTTSALAMLYDRKDATTNPDEWSDLGMQTVYASWKQIEQVLTDEQRAKWDAMLRDAAPAEISAKNDT